MRFFQRADLAPLPVCRLLHAEQLDLHAFRHHRRRVDHDEWTIDASRMAVNRARSQFFAGTGGSNNQNTAVGGRDFFHRLAQLVHFGGRGFPGRI